MHTITKLTAAVICGLALSACGGGGGDDGGTSSSGGNTSNGGTGGNTGGGGTSTGGSGSGGSNTGSGSLTTYTVTPSMNSGGTNGGNTITPANPVTVQSGAQATFTITAGSGYTVSGVGGTCGGTLSGNTYTTNAVTSNCTVQVTFAQVSTGSGSGSASIANCFTVTSNVTFALADSGYPQVGTYPTQSSIGPGTFNGQAATEEINTVSDGVNNYITKDYWTITSSGVSMLGSVLPDGTTFIANPPTIFPLDMQPGQVIEDNNVAGEPRSNTFIGFETLTLDGKTFANTCHFLQQSAGIPIEFWYASGYGVIKSVQTATDMTMVSQYNGDL